MARFLFELVNGLENTLKTQLTEMDTKYTMEEILTFLEGSMDEEGTQAFWEAVEADERLQMEVEACRMLIEEGRRKRFQDFLKEVRDFDAGLPPVD